MLLTDVHNALIKLVEYVPDGMKYGTHTGTITQNTLGTDPNKSKRDMRACSDLLQFCVLNEIDHKNDVRIAMWNVPLKDRFLPSGVGEFMIVWYMQKYPNLFTASDVSPWYSYLKNNFRIDDLFDSVIVTDTVIEPYPVAEAIASVYIEREYIDRDRTERLACEWLRDQFAGRLEVGTIDGRIDVLTPNAVIEVKQAHNWKHALGQVLSYGYHLPGCEQWIVLVGDTASHIDRAKFQADRFGVKVIAFEALTAVMA